MTRGHTCVVAAALAAMMSATPAGAAAPIEPAFRTAAAMGRGVNILGYDGLWTGAADSPFRMSDFALIRKAGFRNVRINLFGFKYLDANLQLDATMLAQLDSVLDHATLAGLVPLIDEHDYQVCQEDPAGCATKLKVFWSQISARYAGRYPSAVFEILNEPGGAMTPAMWNDLLADVLRIIRIGNPHRTVIVAAINSDDPHQPSLLALPEADRAIIVTVHYYKPFRFTHQGAPWAPELAALHDIAWGSAADRQQVEDDFRIVDDWAKGARRPVFLGEFGVYEKAPLAYRTRWLSFVTRTAERLGWPWAYWQFDHDFAIYDQIARRWVQPILQAVSPGLPVKAK